MKTLTDHLSQYATYHRDKRNIITHFVGIPMIVAAVIVLLSQPLPLVFTGVSVGLVLAVLATLFYLRLDVAYGLVLGTMLIAGALWSQQWTATASTAWWLSCGIGLFVIGWIIQFIGHYFEGRKPAFVDDLIGLLIGPLFVLAEAGFLIGWRRDVEESIVARAGATH